MFVSYHDISGDPYMYAGGFTTLKYKGEEIINQPVELGNYGYGISDNLDHWSDIVKYCYGYDRNPWYDYYHDKTLRTGVSS